jgi:hypothetical protein
MMQPVALPRGVSQSLAGAGAVLLGGLIGLLWWLRWRRRGPLRPARPGVRRGLVAAVVVLLVLVGIGIVWRSKVAFDTVAACRTSAGGQRSADPALVAEKVITWPETGLGLLYGDAVGGSLCWYPPADYYVDLHSGRYLGARFMNIGDMVLAPPFEVYVRDPQALAEHEARHRSQWAVVTAIGGPLAYPILYGVVDFFFPGARNPFEKWAGLESGGYQHSGIGPVIGWPQLLVLLVAGALIGMFIYRRLHQGRPLRPARPGRPR